MAIQVPKVLTLTAYGLTMKQSRAHPYGDAYYLEANWLDSRWCPFTLPRSEPFNNEPDALVDFKEKYKKAKEEYLAGGGEDFADPEIEIFSIYG